MAPGMPLKYNLNTYYTFIQFFQYVHMHCVIFIHIHVCSDFNLDDIF